MDKIFDFLKVIYYDFLQKYIYKTKPSGATTSKYQNWIHKQICKSEPCKKTWKSRILQVLKQTIQDLSTTWQTLEIDLFIEGELLLWRAGYILMLKQNKEGKFVWATLLLY